MCRRLLYMKHAMAQIQNIGVQKKATLIMKKQTENRNNQQTNLQEVVSFGEEQRRRDNNSAQKVQAPQRIDVSQAVRPGHHQNYHSVNEA